jgi:hypothetical protein
MTLLVSQLEMSLELAQMGSVFVLPWMIAGYMVRVARLP